MKRKIKLISSIFSLALAFTFMSFGVFAAAQRTVTVGGSLGFVADRIDATVLIKYAAATTASPATTEASYTANATAEGFTNGVVTFSSTNNQGNVSTTIPKFAMTETNKWAGFMIKITATTGGLGVNVDAPSLTNPNSTYFNVTQQTAGTLTTEKKLAAGSSYTIFYVFELRDPKALNDLANVNFSNYVVTLTRPTA